MLSALSSKVLDAMNKAVDKYFFNGFNEVNHFTSLVFVYHIWLLAIFISIKITSEKIIFIHPV